jgi:hypothetical protein
MPQYVELNRHGTGSTTHQQINIALPCEHDMCEIQLSSDDVQKVGRMFPDRNQDHMRT